MSTTVETGWLHDNNGDKFAPKTLTSQVQTSDGTLIEDKIQADIDKSLLSKADKSHNHDSAYDLKGSSDMALDTANAYTDSKTSNLASFYDVDNKIYTHNGSTASHNDIRALIYDLQGDMGSHTHAIADVSGLQSELDGKAASSHGTHVSFSSTAPVMDGTANAGSASTVARSDHKHPIDTSRAAKTDLDSHTSNTTVHITSAERTNWDAAKTHADSSHAPSNAEKNQNAFSNIKVGSTTVAADTATDTLELVGSNVTITPDATNDKVTIAVADGSTSAKGIVQLTNSTSSTSTTTAATPNSVKSAYDLAVAAYTLAESKVNSLSDLGVTATATELNYIDGVASNIQKQFDEMRTHWVEAGSFSLNHAYQVVSDGDTLDMNNPHYTPGDYLVVHLDDVEYKCRMWTNYLGEKCYGDSRITTELTGSGLEITDTTNPESTPFYINCCADDDDLGNLLWTWTVMFNSSISSSSHVINIYDPEYHTINENFIPDTIARTSDVKIAGIIHQYAGQYAPSGYLLCDGSYYRTDEYPELFDAIGFTYGESGSGVNIKFAVPNLSGRVPVGVSSGYALGSTGGEATHTLTINEIPSHDHGAVYTGNADSSNKKYDWYTTTGSKIGYQAMASGGGLAHNNMQPYIALNYIISTGK